MDDESQRVLNRRSWQMCLPRRTFLYITSYINISSNVRGVCTVLYAMLYIFTNKNILLAYNFKPKFSLMALYELVQKGEKNQNKTIT